MMEEPTRPREPLVTPCSATIVPHTHWDREWYLPFQRFRHKLVKLVDELLAIFETNDRYRFMLDGQTIVLEDYLEIKPENQARLMHHVREGRIAVGPWYLLPDEWLVGQESLIRNLETSFDLARVFDIPLMPVGHLPDQFGHSSAIPQLLADLTTFSAATVWRGVGNDVNTVPFTWKAHPASTASLPAVYLAHGYGNASMMPEEKNAFMERLEGIITDLQPFSPFPTHLVMNGSDHLFPQPKLMDFIPAMERRGIKPVFGFLSDYVNDLHARVKAKNYVAPVHVGEFRSAARAHLLQDTYSARMWIKLWNQRNEDMLVGAVEPACTYAWRVAGSDYPAGFIATAWKWHLQNQPHDSICGCSIDQTHEEMKARYSWAQSIGEAVLSDVREVVLGAAKPAATSETIVFNPSNCTGIVPVEIEGPADVVATSVRDEQGNAWDLQPLQSSTQVVYELTVKPLLARAALKMAPGRKITDWYLNDVKYHDGEEPGVLELEASVDKVPIGEFDVDMWKKKAFEVLDSGKYKKIHLVVLTSAKNVYAAAVPLKRWAFTRLTFDTNPATPANPPLAATRDAAENKFYTVRFNKDGTFQLHDKATGVTFTRLHAFEDWGDRGDTYTFGRIGPEKAKAGKVRRTLVSKGPVRGVIKQESRLELFAAVDDARKKRVGKATITVETTFTFHRDIPRVDVTTTLVNTAKDHRLRICFDLPFTASRTRTATHFGTVERDGNPERLESPAEQPSGIQAQKRYIRVDQPGGPAAITVINDGLPEVELVDDRRVAVTLIRAVGFLSRSDYPERPMHAGPFEPTPGAQEIGTPYTFKYAVAVHPSSAPLHESDDLAESATLMPSGILHQQATAARGFCEPILHVDSPWVRFSSLRVRDGRVLATLFNLAPEAIAPAVTLAPGLSTITEARVDGTEKNSTKANRGRATLRFEPHEIKLCVLD